MQLCLPLPDDHDVRELLLPRVWLNSFRELTGVSLKLISFVLIQFTCIGTDENDDVKVGECLLSELFIGVDKSEGEKVFIRQCFKRFPCNRHTRIMPGVMRIGKDEF